MQFDQCLLRAVKAISCSQWNGSNGADCGRIIPTASDPSACVDRYAWRMFVPPCPSEAKAKLDQRPCVLSDSALCLDNSRFRVDVSWQDFQGNSGSGHAVSMTGDTGYFWFFSPDNIELVVKALDARAVNGRFWIFYGALSNVAYTLSVTDTAT